MMFYRGVSLTLLEGNIMKEKATRLATALRDGLDVYHGADMVEDMVEICESVEGITRELEEVKVEIADQKKHLKEFAEFVDEKLDALEDFVIIDDSEGVEAAKILEELRQRVTLECLGGDS